ncbi:hypothetical protein KC717_00885 [Candidatus Dojkabacteria bacterium]|uniref:Uncharacterized protein n=1 Tax=Candidatus Dojkabacteria bacterium TaxID=2099670 RepID=A0A955RKA7_9BACT|nr:hypothetical protein [Candidatus Dojkabacteria bacterium]
MAFDINKIRDDSPESIRRKHGIDTRKKSLDDQFKVYGLPILAILIFFGLLFFVTIPSIGNTFDLVDERDLTNQNLEQKQAELKDLEQLSNSQGLNDQILDTLNTIIPTSKTEVITFEKKVADLAVANLINVDDAIVRERVLVDSQTANAPEGTANTPKSLRLVQIPISFELTGPLLNFRNMLSQIYEGNDFIVISKMKLDIGESDVTTIELVLSKYQFLDFESSQQERQLLDSISYSEVPDQNVIDFIERKTGVAFGQNEGTVPNQTP